MMFYLLVFSLYPKLELELEFKLSLLEDFLFLLLNPIPAGVLENQDMLGGVTLNPPPPLLNPMFDKYDK